MRWIASKSGRLAREIGARDLSADAIELIRAVVSATVDDAEAATLSVRHAADASLALAVADGFRGLAFEGHDETLRAVCRRATLRGVDVVAERSGPVVSVRSLIGLDDDRALDSLDNALLDLGPSDVVIVLGPTSVLCDAMRGERERRRAQSLRGGNLVAALRLPRGVWREAHRQALGVWVCAGRGGVGTPRVADLSAVDEAELDLVDLAADIAAAVQHTESRAFRYARGQALADILARRPVVPRGIRAIRLGAAETAHLDRVHAATLVTGAPLEPLDIVAAPSPGRIRLLQRSLGEMRTLRMLEVKRGSRIDPAEASAEGTVGVLPAGPQPLRFDPLDVERLYPRANRTEPGDVVIVEKPAPRAWVDPIGGHLVASPAKALRLRPTAGVGPHVLAAAINELAQPGSEWPTWAVPILTDDEPARLEAALIAVERYEADVRARVDAVHELKQALIEGVAAGAVTLDVD